MKRLILVPALAFATACANDYPVAPVRDISWPEVASMSRSASSGMVPFTYSGSGTTITSGFGCEGDATNLVLSASGVFYSSHMGKITSTWVNCFTSALAFVSQYGTMTAANGDKVFWYGSADDGSSMVLDFASLTYTASNFWIIGGTGRFEGAVGTFDYYGEFVSDFSSATGIGNGVMSSVGLKNH